MSSQIQNFHMVRVMMLSPRHVKKMPIDLANRLRLCRPSDYAITRLMKYVAEKHPRFRTAMERGISEGDFYPLKSQLEWGETL